MSRLKQARVGVAAVSVITAAAIAVPAFAAAPSRAIQKVVGGTKFVPNRSISDTMHFKKDVIQVQKGGKITLVDTTKQPHSFSLVKSKQVPQTVKQVENCFGKGPCDEIAIAHGAVNPDTGEEQDPTTPLVNAGKAGFNQPGDSVLIPPGGKTTVPVSAPAGATLSYICAIHPWMQGKIKVARAG
ncbi:MAG TPA: plastocyanin/azurin family copper-binding protein [Thermoleophilaceae bacterium]|nr:plastocyanin/azurin family copper-binding protein [Thermoleophilaceae bacterium]